MKKKSVYFIILVMLCFVGCTYGQSRNLPDSIAVKEFTKFVQKHIRYSAIDKENNVSGHVIVDFDVIEGVIINPKVERSLSVASDSEVLRCIAAYNKNTGDGIHLKTKSYTLDINFIIDDGKSSRLYEKVQEPGKGNAIQIMVVGYLVVMR